MAKKKITAMTEFSAPVTASDWLVGVQDSAPEGDKTRKINPTLFKGDDGISGSLPKTIVSNIGDPSTEFNSLSNSGGNFRIAHQVIGTNDYFSLYGWDSSTSEPEEVPHSVDGDGGMWILIYSNAPSIPDKSQKDSGEIHGFVDRSEATLSFDNGTRTLSITPITSFSFYNQGKKFTKISLETKSFIDTIGTWLFYYDNDGILQATQSNPNFQTNTFVSYVHWDGTTGIVLEERHGVTMDWATHRHLHEGLGTLYELGFALSGYTLNLDTDDAVSVGMSGGEIHDEDIEILINHSAAPSAPWEQILNDPAGIPVVYIDSNNFTRDPASDFVFKNTAAGRVNYNLLSGTWMQQEAADNSFVAYFLVATNAITEPIMSIQGQREDASLVDAKSNNQFENLVLSDFISKEVSPLYRIIINTKNTFGGARKAKIIEVLDLRGLRISAGTALNPTSHNGLTDVQGGLAGERYHLTVNEYNTINGSGISSALAAIDIDMSGDGIKTKTISGNTVFTISNPLLDKVIVLRVTGDFTITLPSSVKNKTFVENNYDGTKINLISIYCVDAVTPEYWASLHVGD